MNLINNLKRYISFVPDQKIIDRAVDRAIRNTLLEGLNDVIPGFGHPDVLSRPEVKNFLIQEVSSRIHIALGCASKTARVEALKVSKLRFTNLPKRSQYELRRIALMETVDHLVYLSLAILCSPNIEKCRPSPKRNVVFSYRWRESGDYLFDQRYNINSFNRYARLREMECNTLCVVRTDIASFYDRINLHRIEDALVACKIEDSLVKSLDALLFYWSDQNSYGLPTGGNASRILAECYLTEIDEYLFEKGIPFCRFVDDFRIFAETSGEAHRHLEILAERLAKDGLSLNGKKTFIEDLSNSPGLDDYKEFVAEAPKNPHPMNTWLRYAGDAPMAFREPSVPELAEGKKMCAETTFSEMSHKASLSGKEMRTLCNICWIHGQQYVPMLLRSLEKNPRYVFAIVDLIIKLPELSEQTKSNVTLVIRELLLAEWPEYFYVAISTLLSESGLANRALLVKILNQCNPSYGHLQFVTALKSLSPLATKALWTDLKNRMSTSNADEMIIICGIADRVLNEGERRAWYKTIMPDISTRQFARVVINSSSNSKTQQKNITLR